MPARLLHDEERRAMREYNETRYDFSFANAPSDVSGMFSVFKWDQSVKAPIRFACDIVLLIIMGVFGIFAIISKSQHPVARVDLVNSVFVFEDPMHSQKIDSIVKVVDELCADSTLTKELYKKSLYGYNVLQLALEAEVGLDLWALVICVVITTVLAQVYRVNFNWLRQLGLVYEPDGPDFGRWLEYTVSSPLQVVIVAAAFHTRETATLVAIGLLQATLTWMGYGIEKCLAAWHDTSHSILKQLEIFVPFALATGAHVAIWWLIKLRTDKEHKLLCLQNAQDDMDAALDFIYYSQCILFSLFPFVCLISTIYVVMSKKPPDSAFWHDLARGYSFLSVLAKSFLVGGFYMYAQTFDGLQDAMIAATPAPATSMDATLAPAASA
jgi:hypothetical protein